ncbi:uncharacterized protein HGUI_01425 [Hanseniaspora guilliermondii]|uniref:Uncharacterized protein n=1 Tax=Hanseniaspora guilliermondii TaxID=56406 RepID=A0A1L0CLF4_9ASCO|nr:uncharacterized protein HGUI_01425 [Hanseniaspora guilliermondii]
MNILDNKKKLKDTLELYSNNIFKYKLSNKPNKFNASSNDLKKEYKKLTKLRKDINDLMEDDPNDSRLAYIKLSVPLMHETIQKYEEVLVENGEPIMELPNSSTKKDPDAMNSTATNIALSDADAIRASKKEQRRLMKEKKNKMKLQAKLAQQEAFNNKQIMITEKSAKDIVIELPPEPSAPSKTSVDPDNESLRVEHVPKVKKSEDKKKKKEKLITTVEKNISITSSAPKPVSTGLGLASALPSKTLTATTSLTSTSSLTNIEDSPAAPKAVEWSELATQRKLKEHEEKLNEERIKAEQEKLRKQKEDREKYLKDKFTVPSVFLKLQLPHFTSRVFESGNDSLEKTEINYKIGSDNLHMKYDNSKFTSQKSVFESYKNDINVNYPELPEPLKQIFTDMHVIKSTAFNKSSDDTTEPRWYDFQESQEFANFQTTNELTSKQNSSNNTSTQGIVITGRRHDKDNGTDEKEKAKVEENHNYDFGFSFTHGLISNIFEQCVDNNM